MGAGRESADIWWCIFHRYPSGRWAGWNLLGHNFWLNTHLLHDSFGKYWNRMIGCRVFEHRNIQDVSDPGEPKEMHCFNCEKRIK